MKKRVISKRGQEANIFQKRNCVNSNQISTLNKAAIYIWA